MVAAACSGNDSSGSRDAETRDASVAGDATTNLDAALADAARDGAAPDEAGVDDDAYASSGDDRACIHAGGVCISVPGSSCDLVPGFDPLNSGCPHAPFAIRCCAADAGVDAGAKDASAE